MTPQWTVPPPEMRVTDGLPVLTWQSERPWLAISSAPHGGGVGERSWVLNATVPTGYARTDPDVHVAELAAECGLTGAGTGMLTAVDVRQAVAAAEAGVCARVSTGVGQPIWAAAAEHEAEVLSPLPAGTINVIAWLPTRMSEAALVNAVATTAEAKAQALIEAGVDGTGTCTDATVLLCPASGPVEPYGGPRSRYGSVLARVARRAVAAGLRVDDPRFSG